jgi:hypothetical protein
MTAQLGEARCAGAALHRGDVGAACQKNLEPNLEFINFLQNNFNENDGAIIPADRSRQTLLLLEPSGPAGCWQGIPPECCILGNTCRASF